MDSAPSSSTGAAPSALPLDAETADAIVHRALLPAGVTLAAMYVFFIASDLFLRPPEVGLAILAGDVACLVYFALLALAVWRGRVPVAWSQPALGSLAFVLLASIFHLFFVEPDPVHTLYLMLLVIGSGSLLLSWAWFGLVAIATLAEWILVAIDAGGGEAWLNFGLGLVAAVGLGAMLHANRRRTVAQLHALHLQDVRARSELEQTIAAVRLHEDRFQLLAAATHDIAWDWNVRDGTLWWNDNFYRVLGHQRGRGETRLPFWASRIHPDDRRRVMASLHAAMDGDGTAWSEEYLCQRGDGSYVRLLDRGRVLRDESGRAVRMVGFMMDVTAAREAEQKLREERELYASLLETLGREGHAMALVDGDRVAYANAAGRSALAMPDDARTGPLVASALALLAEDGGSRVELATRDGMRITAHALERGTCARVLLVVERAVRP